MKKKRSTRRDVEELGNRRQAGFFYESDIPIYIAHVRWRIEQGNGIVLLEDGSSLGPSARLIA